MTLGFPCESASVIPIINTSMNFSGAGCSRCLEVGAGPRKSRSDFPGKASGFRHCLCLGARNSQEMKALCSDASLESLPMCPLGIIVGLICPSRVRMRLSLSCVFLTGARCWSYAMRTARLLGKRTRIDVSYEKPIDFLSFWLPH